MKVDFQKDKTKKLKRVLSTTVETDIEGLGTVSAAAELPSDSVFAKELDWIVTDIIEQKKKVIREKTKRLIAKRKNK